MFILLVRCLTICVFAKKTYTIPFTICIYSLCCNGYVRECFGNQGFMCNILAYVYISKYTKETEKQQRMFCLVYGKF